VVASPNVGAREVSGDGKYAALPADADLAETLARLLLDEAERGRLREAGLARSRDFSWDTVCQRYEELYVPPLPSARSEVA
jgi:glycosyltransferase involved in cell wall biosynthesis